MKKKSVALLLALVLVFGVAVGGTIAYLSDKTEAITNTFTVGNVDIDLTESKTNFKMTPGSTIDKDPKVSVKAGSEACWLFVEITKSANLDTYIDYDVADGWTEFEGAEGATGTVYYRTAEAGEEFSVLAGDQVTVLSTVTNAQMDAAETNAPTLTFTAYAVQTANVTTVAAAWDAAKTASVYPGT